MVRKNGGLEASPVIPSSRGVQRGRGSKGLVAFRACIEGENDGVGGRKIFADLGYPHLTQIVISLLKNPEGVSPGVQAKNLGRFEIRQPLRESAASHRLCCDLEPIMRQVFLF